MKTDTSEPLRYGGLELSGPVICAPICGASKIPYRLLARRFGASLAYTEMIKGTPLSRHDHKTYSLAARHPDETPSAIQICGARPDEMAEAARVAVEELGFDTVDINMGCPVRKIVREGAGAAMLKEPDAVERIVGVVARAVNVPVTAKIRTGWDGEAVSAVPVARAAERGGAVAVAIHGRHRGQRHSGEIDYDAMAEAAAAVDIPIIGNGSITSPEAAVRMVEATGCRGLMIGRGAFGTPWIFRDVAHALRGEPVPPPPPLEEQLEVALWHHQMTIDQFGEVNGGRLFRKFAAWYFRHAPFGNQFRGRVYKAKHTAEVRALLREWFEHRRRLIDEARERGLEATARFIMGSTSEADQRVGLAPMGWVGHLEEEVAKAIAPAAPNTA